MKSPACRLDDAMREEKKQKEKDIRCIFAHDVLFTYVQSGISKKNDEAGGRVNDGVIFRRMEDDISSNSGGLSHYFQN